METRGRGRDAGAGTDENPSTSTPNNQNPSSSAVAPRAPSTRSRTRLRAAAAAAAASHQTPTRTTRSSTTAGALHPSQPPASSAGAPQSSTPALATGRLRRQLSIGRRTASLSAAAPASGTRSATALRQLAAASSAGPASASTRAPVTRKRTRSSVRRGAAQAVHDQPFSVNPPTARRATALAASAAATVAASAVSTALHTRPSKRARRASTGGRQPRNISHFTVTGRSSAVTGSSRRRGADMDPADPSGGSNDRQPDHIELRREEDGPNSFGSDRTGATTLQGLLRRLGADFSEIFPGNVGTSHSRLQQLRSSISSPESDEQQIQALSELCEFLSVGTEESLVSFSVNLFVVPLVEILRTGSNVEIKILAARALTHMMEALPSSSSSIANHGAAGPLCQNLLSIEYIDLAEQSLYALRKLSVDYPQQIVSANGFQAVLSFIDFFSIGVQRVAAQTACNLCRLPRPDAMDMVSGVLPTMLRLIDSEDQRIRESAVLGYSRLAESFKTASAKLETLCGEKAALIDKILGLIVPSSPPALAPPSYSSALRLLATIARGNASLGLQILSTNSLILKLQSTLSSGSSFHALDCLGLAESLLPDILEFEGAQSSSRSRRRHRIVSSTAAFAAVDARRRDELSKDVTPLLGFGRTLFAVLMKFYISSADANARRSALSVMSKFIAIVPKEVLCDMVENNDISTGEGSPKTSGISFCPFVATLLGENSSRCETLVGLAMTDSTLQKLPTLRNSFIREGVVHEIVRLAAFDAETHAEEDGREVPGDDGSPPERGPISSADRLAAAISSRGTESMWSTVAAVQRGNVQRCFTGELMPSRQRFQSRNVDIRSSDVQPLQSLVLKAARSILETHLGAEADGTLDESVFNNTRLGKLTEIGGLLSDPTSTKSDSTGKQALSDLVELLISDERLTVFEVSKSGLMESLAEYLTPGDGGLRAKRAGALIHALNQDNNSGAFSALVNLALGVLSSEEKLTLQTNETSSGTTVASVSSGLRQLAQPFKLRLRKTIDSGSGSLRDYSHHVVLIEPLATMASVQEFLWPKVRESERGSAANIGSSSRRNTQSRDRRTSRIIDDEAGPNESADGNDDRATDELDDERYGEEGMFNMEEENHDEEEMIDEEEEQNSDPSDEEVSSGGEEVIEQDVGDMDEQEPDGADSFDVDQLSISLPPFELDHETLGQAPSRGRRSGSGAPRDGLARAGSASRQTSESMANFRSYAAALAANMPRSIDRISMPGVSPHGTARRHSLSVGGRENLAVSSVPKLSFSLNGKAVPQDCSILSAVIQCTPDHQGIGSRLWSDVHTLIYSRVESIRKTGESAAQDASRGSSSGSESKRVGASGDNIGVMRRSQRLLENRERSGSMSADLKNSLGTETPAHVLEKVLVSEEVVPAPPLSVISDLPSSVACLIEVLRQLHWIYVRMSDRVVSKNGLYFINEGLREDTNVQFHSDKLNAKLVRQLSDPLVICGGVVPNWCFSLSRGATFLIPFETRRILFQSTSLGVARALHLLQSRAESSGVSATSHRGSRGHRDHETRIGRIQRQKVRLHRNRILESAIKVMNFYAKHSTVLEVEYFDEVGTGLGPTLEFYTLASRELQKVDLGLWRGTAPAVAKQKNQSEEQAVAGTATEQKADTSANRPATVARRRNRRNSSSLGASRVTSNSAEDEDAVAYVVPTGKGLFPSCLPIAATDSQKEASSKSTALFGFVGRLVGKAVVDGRLLDLRFSKTLSELLLAYCRVFYERWKSSLPSSGESCHVSHDGAVHGKVALENLDDTAREQIWEMFTCGTSAMKLLEDVDPQLASSLTTILDMVHNGQSDSVSSLCLTFVLPGDDEVELIKNGRDIEVTGKNAEEFVRRVVHHVLFGGVQQQVEALLRGLNEVLDVRGLLAFEGTELELLICGPSFEKWTVNFLVQASRCDHGYSHESQAVLYFLQVLSEMDQSDQQRFVLFATGSPALPLGGLRKLHPRLTIVRRTPEGGRSPDVTLPTVMTCTNYFKLPEYSSLEITRKQVMYAVREGQGSFHLS